MVLRLKRARRDCIDAVRSRWKRFFDPRLCERQSDPGGRSPIVVNRRSERLAIKIRIVGTGAEVLSTPVRGAQNGSFTIGGRSLKFSGVKSIETSKLNTLSWLDSEDDRCFTRYKPLWDG